MSRLLLEEAEVNAAADEAEARAREENARAAREYETRERDARERDACEAEAREQARALRIRAAVLAELLDGSAAIVTASHGDRDGITEADATDEAEAHGSASAACAPPDATTLGGCVGDGGSFSMSFGIKLPPLAPKPSPKPTSAPEPTPALLPEVSYATPEEARAAFKDMLHDEGIGTTEGPTANVEGDVTTEASTTPAATTGAANDAMAAFPTSVATPTPADGGASVSASVVDGSASVPASVVSTTTRLTSEQKTLQIQQAVAVHARQRAAYEQQLQQQQEQQQRDQTEARRQQAAPTQQYYGGIPGIHPYPSIPKVTLRGGGAGARRVGSREHLQASQCGRARCGAHGVAVVALRCSCALGHRRHPPRGRRQSWAWSHHLAAAAVRA